MGYFFGGAHHLRDGKAHWCKDKGLVIHRVRGHGKCLCTCLGKSKHMEGNQVRAELLERMLERWGKLWNMILMAVDLNITRKRL
eukprot:3633186-Heterocapsa_arctica.AAC.1